MKKKLEPNGYGHFVDGSTRLQFAISGSMPELGQTFESEHLISLWRLPGQGFWSPPEGNQMLGFRYLGKFWDETANGKL